MEPDTSPTARVLLALELLQATPGITADRLADKLGVSERAVRRYVGILREAGIPVDAERGPYGGYRLGRGVRLPPLVFSADEALGLVMAVLDGHHEAGDPTDPVGSALGKIMRGLPEPVAAQAEAVRRATAPAPDRAAARPDPGLTAALVDACSNRRTVRLGYRSEAGSTWEAEVDPWAVVVRHGRWYLLCRSHRADRADATRAYRIDRIGTVTQQDASFIPPADLDPVAALEQHLAVGWEYEAEVVIDASVEAVGRCVPRALGRLEPLDDGRTRLVGSTSNPWWYAEQLAPVPASFRIVRGPEVQAAARAVGRRLLASVEDVGERSEVQAAATDQASPPGAVPQSIRATSDTGWPRCVSLSGVHDRPGGPDPALADALLGPGEDLATVGLGLAGDRGDLVVGVVEDVPPDIDVNHF